MPFDRLGPLYAVPFRNGGNFTIYLRRHLARQLAMTVSQFRHTVRVSYATGAEFQRRAVVHFHAIIRLDDATRHGAPAAVGAG